VLRGDGGLGGYRWGLERKRILIDHERAHCVIPVR
jgi:AraC family transcriptional regulator of adaptative response/methylated-DNA-[protein]-cysteine methyltransferase